MLHDRAIIGTAYVRVRPSQGLSICVSDRCDAEHKRHVVGVAKSATG